MPRRSYKALVAPPIPLKSDPAPDTRDRLLNAAGEVFAEFGFRDATVRDICSRAGANIAAINYHFGDKQAIYTAAMDRMHASCKGADVADISPDLAPEEALHFYIRGFVENLLSKKDPEWYGKLMAREMVEPTPALDMIVEKYIRPRWSFLTGVVSRIIDRPLDDWDTILSSSSIIGQCLHRWQCEQVIQRLIPQKFRTRTPEEIERVGEHIFRFSLAALHAIRDERFQPKTSTKARKAISASARGRRA